jgi:hypothetical protein
MKNLDFIKSLDSRDMIHGWCSGEYITTCIDCKSQFVGDKRSYNCADCAYEKDDNYKTSQKIKVWRAYFDGQAYHTSNDNILTDTIKIFMSESSPNQSLKITHDIMSESDYNELKEFDGY